MKIRNIKLDNAKGILIFFVVLGHLLELNQGWDSEPNRFILNFIYSFHMPAFALACGITANKNQLKKRVFNLLFIYVAFNIFYSIPLIIKGDLTYYNLIVPQQGLWFLSALACWTVFLPFILNWKNRAILGLIIISVCINLINFDGYIFSVVRTFSFFPFFAIGVVYKDCFLNLKLKLAIVLLFFIGIGALYFYHLSDRWFLGSYTYSQLDSPFYLGMIIKLLLFILAILGCLVVFMICTEKKHFYTHWGMNSLSIYLIHFIFTKYLVKWINLPVTFVTSFVFILLAFVICTFTSSNIFSKPIRFLFKFPEKIIHRLFS